MSVNTTNKEQEKKDEHVSPSSLVKAMRKPCGKPPIYKKPEKLWEDFVRYTDFVDGNPWQTRNASNSIHGGNINGMRQDVRVIQRAYTLYGFCAFAGLYKWADFKKAYSVKPGFLEVINAIESVVTAQQVDGALIHQFDGSLVARLNGIADTQINEIKGDVFKFPKLSNEDLEELKKLNGLR